MKKIIVSIFTLVLATGIQSAVAQSTVISSTSDQTQVHSTQANQENLNAAENAKIEAAKQAEAQKLQAEQKEKEAYILKLEKNKAQAATSSATNVAGSSVSTGTKQNSPSVK